MTDNAWYFTTEHGRDIVVVAQRFESGAEILHVFDADIYDFMLADLESISDE